MQRSLIRWTLSLMTLFLSGCNLVAGTLTPTPVPDVPTIQFQTPENSSTFVEGTDIQIELVAQDSIGDGVARIELFVDDRLVQQATPQVSSAVPVFTVNMNWLARGIGLHVISAVAYRSDGTPSTPANIRVLVDLLDPTPTS